MTLLFNPTRSIKRFILTAAVLVSLALFGIAYLVVSQIYDQSLRQDARQVARIVSGQVFSAMYQVMSRGWSRAELEQFLAGLRSSTDDTTYSWISTADRWSAHAMARSTSRPWTVPWRPCSAMGSG